MKLDLTLQRIHKEIYEEITNDNDFMRNYLEGECGFILNSDLIESVIHSLYERAREEIAKLSQPNQLISLIRETRIPKMGTFAPNKAHIPDFNGFKLKHVTLVNSRQNRVRNKIAAKKKELNEQNGFKRKDLNTTAHLIAKEMYRQNLIPDSITYWRSLVRPSKNLKVMCTANVKTIESFLKEGLTYILTTDNREMDITMFHRFLINARNRGLNEFNIAQIVKVRITSGHEVQLSKLINLG